MRVLLLSDQGQLYWGPVVPVLESMGYIFGRLALDELNDGAPVFPGPLKKLNRYYYSRAFLSRLRERIVAFAPDIIHVNGVRSNVIKTIAACAGVSDAAIIYERGTIEGINSLSPLDWMLFRHKRLTQVVAPARACINNWMGHPLIRAVMQAEKCDVLPHVVPLPEAVNVNQRQAIRHSLGFEDDAFVVGTACNIRPIKNLAFVAKAIAAVTSDRPVIFAVMGPAHRKESVMRPIIEAGGPRLRLLGHCPHAASLMPALDLYVTPTRTPGEGFGLAFAEAMACGVPGITMTYGASAELCENGISGFAIPEDQKGWTALIERLIANTVLLRRLGEGARERIATRFSPQAIAGEFDRVYSNAKTQRL